MLGHASKQSIDKLERYIAILWSGSVNRRPIRETDFNYHEVHSVIMPCRFGKFVLHSNMVVGHR